MEEKNKDIAVGINFGLSNTSCVVQKNYCEVVVPNEQGNKVTPNYIQFTNDSIIIGEQAKENFHKDPSNTVYDIQILLGQKFLYKQIQDEIKNWSFQINPVEDKKIDYLPQNQTLQYQQQYEKYLQQQDLQISVKYKGEKKNYYSEDLAALIFQNIKKNTEQFLNQQIKNVVITVPINFNDKQRKAIKDACLLAQLNLLRIINEPTAASIAYEIEKNQYKNQEIMKVLVFDLGCKTFNLTVLNIEEGIYEIVANQQTKLGGYDFDKKLFEFFVSEYLQNDLIKNPSFKQKLLNLCEKAKIQLSINVQTSIEFDYLSDAEEFIITISRAKFEKICLELFKDINKKLESCLKEAKISKCEIDEIVLVGGSSKIPKIQKLIEENFPNKKIHNTLDPQEVIAIGAAKQAGILLQTNNEYHLCNCFFDICPLSIGIESVSGKYLPLIPRNTYIPVKKTFIFKTSSDLQKNLKLNFYEGERNIAKQNLFLDFLEYKDIPPETKGFHRFQVTLEIDTNTILKITVKPLTFNGKTQELIIENDKFIPNNDKIQEMIIEAEQYLKQDKIEKQKQDAQKELETLTTFIKNCAHQQNVMSLISQEEFQKLVLIVSQINETIQNHPQLDLLEINQKLQEFQDQSNPILTKICGQTYIQYKYHIKKQDHNEYIKQQQLQQTIPLIDEVD
ncbi:hypothetical protein PPERSA_11515 [Pseudocohnilembus persalinus]|uniref:Heat shock protein 70 family n=1 Tax=Pseudocohnilembus persalinus TaxID=266149 RepID=A0A0V0QXD3_PSEPJ|nr:hypothetical protein PPERSA_11515 [Pseudocohnilembus persalinus]|eukprot:KRX06870.1 hypothetical protein PPERSA_11515 [Pseudocohnilembus persalinus]